MSGYRVELVDGKTGVPNVVCTCPTKAEATYCLRQRWMDNVRAVDDGYPGYVSPLDGDEFEIRRERRGPRLALYRVVVIEEP